jgi:hypothetical protein
VGWACASGSMPNYQHVPEYVHISTRKYGPKFECERRYQRAGSGFIIYCPLRNAPPPCPGPRRVSHATHVRPRAHSAKNRSRIIVGGNAGLSSERVGDSFRNFFFRNFSFVSVVCEISEAADLCSFMKKRMNQGILLK